MATIYKVEVVSHWISYSEDTIKEIVSKSLKNLETEISVTEVVKQ